MPKRYKSISARARKLLSGDEGGDVDFKQNDKFDSEDLVAFANSESGGAILLGVQEKANGSGQMVGIPVGCRLTDKLRLSILSKAASCVPPIELTITEENGDKTPFVRVEIRSGAHKPYCTLSGVYKIRGDGANKALTPPLLLRLFMESEANAFIERFRQATEALTKEVGDFRENMEAELKAMGHDLGAAHQELESGLIQLGADASDALTYSEAATEMAEMGHDAASDAVDKISELQCEVADLRMKMDSLLLHHKVRDSSIKYNNMHGLLRHGIFERDGVTTEERKRLFFEAFPTAQEEDWQDAQREHAARSANQSRKKMRTKREEGK